jgi:hypothetical protein
MKLEDYLGTRPRRLTGSLARAQEDNQVAFERHRQLFLQETHTASQDFQLHSCAQLKEVSAHKKELISISRIGYTPNKLSGIRVTTYVEADQFKGAMSRYPRPATLAGITIGCEPAGQVMESVYLRLHTDPDHKFSDLRFQQQTTLYRVVCVAAGGADLTLVEYVHSRTNNVVFRFDERRD